MCARVVDKPQKRLEILRAAMQVFAEQGVSKVKMSDIACRAGIGKGTLYEYFSSKEELTAGVFALFMQDYEDFVGHRLEHLGTASEQIKAFIRLSFEFVAEKEDVLSLILDLWATSVPRSGLDLIDSEISREYRAFIDYIQAILERGIEQGDFRAHRTDLTASMILALLDGLMFQAILGIIDIHDPNVPETIADHLLISLAKIEIDN